MGVAFENDVKVLALLGTITYTESHGHFIENRDDLMKYNETAFSVSKIEQEIKDQKNHFYIISNNDLPIGYAKLVINAVHDGIPSLRGCLLERIYILNDFIPLKAGQRFLTFLEEKTKAFQMDMMWLSVHSKNIRAIRFYEKNAFKNVGKSVFFVNKKPYENIIFSKEL